MGFEFFADRNCGCHVFPEMLRGAGIVVHRHRDHFRDDVEDDVWLPEVAARGWVALSFDKAIRKNELERNAVFLSRARLIQLTGANADASQQARNFINTYRKIEDYLSRTPAPFIARVRRPSPADLALGRPGTIDTYLSLEGWKAKYGPV